MLTSETTLGSLVKAGVLEMSDGYRTKASELGSDGIPILRVSEVQDGSLRPALKDRVREEYRRKMGVKTSRPGDILVTTKGTVGRVARVPSDSAEFVYSPQLCFFRVLDESVLLPGWLYAWFRSPAFSNQAAALAGQTDMAPYLNLADLRSISLAVPTLSQQSGVADVIEALDNKVDVNGKVVQTATALTRCALESCDFDRRTPLSVVADVRKGLSYTSAGLAESGMPMVNLANAAVFGGFKRSGWKYYTGDYKPRHLARGGDLLVANTDLTWKLEALGWPMLVPDDVEEALFSQDISIIDFKSEWRHLRLPTWAHLFTTEARQRIEGMAYGTTVARFSPEALTGLEVPVLDPLHPVLEQAEALLARAWAAERESMALVKLRDALLPALMSGRLRVREAEELVGEAV